MRARNANSGEPIWEGRIHLGDEPGIYGAATYAGIANDFPVTLTPFNPAGGTPPDISFAISANRITIYPPYKGHVVTVYAYTQDVVANPPTWSRRAVGNALMDQASIEVQTSGVNDERYFSVRIEVATDVAPGLYDDFVLRTLTLKSTTHYADFGFRYI